MGKAIYPQDIFATLKHYEKGFFKRACTAEALSYRTQSARIKERITAGAETLEDIIYDEQQRVAKAQLRASFTTHDTAARAEAQGYWSAVELIRCSLTDSLPYKAENDNAEKTITAELKKMHGDRIKTGKALSKKQREDN